MRRKGKMNVLHLGGKPKVLREGKRFCAKKVALMLRGKQL
jgi:hypothetical protein